jgi:hypothetical protein
VLWDWHGGGKRTFTDDLRRRIEAFEARTDAAEAARGEAR